MWVRFIYDQRFDCQHWERAISPEQSGTVEVPDHVVRRWELTWELFVEVQIEAGEWKARGWNPATKRLPERPSMLLPLEEVS